MRRDVKAGLGLSAVTVCVAGWYFLSTPSKEDSISLGEDDAVIVSLGADEDDGADELFSENIAAREGDGSVTSRGSDRAAPSLAQQGAAVADAPGGGELQEAHSAARGLVESSGAGVLPPTVVAAGGDGQVASDAGAESAEAARSRPVRLIAERGGPDTDAGEPVQPANAAPDAKSAVKTSAPGTYVVCEQDTLYGIAVRMLGKGSRWPVIFVIIRALLVDDPNALRPGQVLRLPVEGKTHSKP